MAMPASRGLLYAHGQENSAGNYSSDGNNTIDCLANCIGFCNAGVCFPSPPSSQHNGNSGNVTTPISLHNRFGALPTLTITAICSIVVSFLILMSLYIYFRLRRRGRRNLPQAPAAAEVAVDDDEDVRPGGDTEHHIWYIRTPGLDESTITSIAAWIYKSGDGVVDGRDCPVCLGEFHDGELVRLLPKCSHAFHLLCIDTWLRSHVNCPLCRAPILSQPPDSSPAPDSATDSPETEIRSSDSIENPQVEAPTRPSNDDGFEFRIGIHPAEEPSSHHANSDLQPIRRSISVDSLSVDILIMEERVERTFAVDEDERSSPNRKKRRNIRLKAHTSMLRSLSSRSSRLVFSKK